MDNTDHLYSYPSPDNNIDLSALGPIDFSITPQPHLQNRYDVSPGKNSKRNVDRACDACRRRKIRCDGPKMQENVCTNCRQNKKPCTYLEASKPRGPPRAYVTGLEDRIESLEALLEQLQPGGDFSHEIGPPIPRGSWKWSKSLSSSAHEPKNPISLHKPSSVLAKFNPGQQTASLSLQLEPIQNQPLVTLEGRQSFEDDTENESASSGDSSNFDIIEIESISGLVQKLTLRGIEADTKNPPSNHARFHGRSSAVGLVDATRKFKLMHLQERADDDRPTEQLLPSINDRPVASPRRVEYWHMPTWERVWEGVQVDSHALFSSVLATFPPPDLATELIHLYFLHVNDHFPLLHRPTFNRQWQEHLHHTNIWFACVCMLLFAVASRWTDDPRVVKGFKDTDSSSIDWRLAGWSYFEAGIDIHRTRRSLFFPATLFEIQTFTLIGVFLGGTTSHAAAWVFISVGIRKAQDVGAHRQKVYGAKPSVDEELWKRAFWCLVVIDRVESAILGRGCSAGEEDFDVDLPLEVDDEYWETPDSTTDFKQQAEIPAKVCAFNHLIGLSRIMALALKTVYPVDQSVVLYGLTPASEEALRQLHTSLSQWAAGLPNHLVWSHQMEATAFTSAAAMLRVFYHLTQMLIHRPFFTSSEIPFLSNSPSLYRTNQQSLSCLPMEICIEAARSCARIAEVELQQGCLNPFLLHAAQVGAGVLLVKIWKLKAREKVLTQDSKDIKLPFIQRIEPLMEDVKILLGVLEWMEPRWPVASRFLRELRQAFPDGEKVDTSRWLYTEVPARWHMDPGSASATSKAIAVPASRSTFAQSVPGLCIHIPTNVSAASRTHRYSAAIS